MPTFLTLGGLLGFGFSSLVFDREQNNFDFSPNITYLGDNTVFNDTDINTMSNSQTQSSSQTSTNNVNTNNNNDFTNTVVPIVINGNGNDQWYSWP